MEEDRDTEAACYLGLDFSTQQVGDGCQRNVFDTFIRPRSKQW